VLGKGGALSSIRHSFSSVILSEVEGSPRSDASPLLLLSLQSKAKACPEPLSNGNQFAYLVLGKQTMP
jgi:hypothetical protein